MKKIVLTFGLISGLISAAMLVIMVPLYMSGRIGFDKGQIIGYSAMVLAFLLVFFGIRSYRENVAGGAITFGKAFQVGILITLVSCAVYVVAWEIYYFNFAPDFGDRYSAFVIDKMRAEGASGAEITKMEAKMADFRRLYANPLFNAGITFMEVFPVGLIMTLISAAILGVRRGQPPLSHPDGKAASPPHS